MIHQSDSQQIASFLQTLGYGYILAAWYWVAAWVVVRQDNGCGHELDSRGVCFSRMHEIGVERAPTDFSPPQKLISDIQE